jgi:hypothetical protein
MKISIKKILIITIIGFILYCILFIGIFSATALSLYDIKLINVWYKRPDLQKTFPDFSKDFSKIDKWARKYGWKEDYSLWRYSPYVKMINYAIEENSKSLTCSNENLEIQYLKSQVNDLKLQVLKLSLSQTSVINVQNNITENITIYCIRDREPETRGFGSKTYCDENPGIQNIVHFTPLKEEYGNRTCQEILTVSSTIYQASDTGNIIISGIKYIEIPRFQCFEK